MNPDKFTWLEMSPGSASDYYRMLKVGRVFRTAGGEVVLVGDINEQGGVCNDCTDGVLLVAYSDDLIEAYT